MRGWLAGAALLALLASTGPAAAQSNAEAARNLFNAGVSAYKAGKFLAAGRAFLEARKQLKRPELLFSAAQAFRRQFHVDGKPEHLQLAIDQYRKYLDEVPTGGRRLDAANALAELTPVMEKLGVTEVTNPEASMSFGTGLMLTSPVEDAVASFDGGPPRRLPLDLAVEPGPHHVMVHASGYRSAKRDVVAVKGQLAAVDVPLEEDPAKLTIDSVDGAEVRVDGRVLASTPLSRPLPIEPGVHLVEVRRTGYIPYAQELELKRGTRTAISLDQPTTHQRRAAMASLVTGGIAVAGGIAMAIAAVVREQRAKDIDAARQSRSISEGERMDFNRALADRDNLLLAGGVTSGVGVGLSTLGLLLYFFDDPGVEPIELDAPRPAPSDPRHQPGLEMMLGPTGLGIQGRF